MSNDRSTDPPEPNPLQIVDDATPRDESLLWAIDQLRAGRAFDELIVELTETGWNDEAASQIVEEARQRTRADRGVVTREQVTRAMNANYRRGMGNGLFSGMPALAALRRLLYSISSMKILNRWRR